MRVFSVVFLTALVFHVSVLPQRSALTVEERNRKIAERTWEQMVKAKGGRESLQNISNLLLRTGKEDGDMHIRFYVYPQKFWEWNKDAKFHGFMLVQMSNLDTGVFIGAGYDGIVNNQKFKPAEGGTSYRESWLIDACALLLETRWLKPTPVNITRETIAKERLDVVETTFPDLTVLKGWGLRYYIDPESLEVKYVVYLNKLGKPYAYDYFDGQITSGGIMVPKGIFSSLAAKEISQPKKSAFAPTKFEFNVDYDTKLFERPPSVEAGPEAWKPKSSL